MNKVSHVYLCHPNLENTGYPFMLILLYLCHPYLQDIPCTHVNITLFVERKQDIPCMYIKVLKFNGWCVTFIDMYLIF